MVKPCKSNEKRIKSYTRVGGVKVKSHCRLSRKCSRGKKYRKSYVRKSGTKVKGHCVSSRRSSRRGSRSPSFSRQEQPYFKSYGPKVGGNRNMGIGGSEYQKQEYEYKNMPGLGSSKKPNYEEKYEEEEEAEPSSFDMMQKEACMKLFTKYNLWSNDLATFKKNFRQWSLRNHPDKNPEMADVYGEIAGCYKDILKSVWNVSF